MAFIIFIIFLVMLNPTALIGIDKMPFSNDSLPLLVPEPHRITWYFNNNFHIDSSCVIAISNRKDTIAARILQKEIMNSCNIYLDIETDFPKGHAIVLRRKGDWNTIPHNDKLPQDLEAYSLIINHNYCIITGNSKYGIFYGAMTMKQLIAQHYGGEIPGSMIIDFPDLAFRGLRTRYSAEPSWQDTIRKRVEYYASLKLNNFIIESWDFWRSDSANAETIKSTLEYCREHSLEPIPLLQSFGHGGNVLNQNPYCGEAIHRHKEHFCFIDGRAWSLENSNKFSKLDITDIGFELFSGNRLLAWNQNDIESTIFMDNSNQHAGSNCIMIKRNTFGTSRVWQELSCSPNTLYAVWFFVKTHEVTGRSSNESSGLFIQILGKNEKNDWDLIKKSSPTDGSHDWQQLSVVFHSGKYTYIRLVIVLSNAKGFVWVDSERIPIINNNNFERKNFEKTWIHKGGGNVSLVKGLGIHVSNACLLARNNNGYTHLDQDVETEPGYDYQLCAWAKAADISSGSCYCTAFWVGKNSRQFWQYGANPELYQEFKELLMSNEIKGYQDWSQLSTNIFNTGSCSKIRIKLILNGIGTAYFDDVEIKKINTSLVNIDTLAPLTITSETNNEYTFKQDYDIIYDSKLTYPYISSAEPARIITTNTSQITDTQIVYISYDKLPAFKSINMPYYYPYCPNKEATKIIMDTTIVNAINHWDPNSFHFGHDEIAFMKTDYHCIKSSRKRSDILADEINRLYNLVKPRQMMIWADMFNPYHLGTFFFDDPLFDATNHIDTNIIPIIWFYSDKEPLTRGDSSLSFFGKRGFKTIATCAGYTIQNVYNWAYEIKHRYVFHTDSSCIGLLYAKWGSDRDFTDRDWYSLPVAAEYSWHWPDSLRNRSLKTLRYDPSTFHKNYGDIFVPRPAGLQSKVLTDTLILLSWHKNPNIDHAHYIILRDTISIATTLDTQYIDKRLPGKHTYHIIAIDKLENRSCLSQEVSIE